MKPTTLIFVRHGQSVSNLDCTFTGQANVHLTELGLKQAEATASFLKQYPIDVIYSSDLTRSMETATPTAKLFHQPIHPCPDLREIQAGEWTGRSYTYLQKVYPEAYNDWLFRLGYAQPVGGESVRQLADRISCAVEKIVANHPGQCVAVFSHATPMRVMACIWKKMPIERVGEIPWGGNASVSVAEYSSPSSFKLLYYGYSEHQGTLATELPKNV